MAENPYAPPVTPAVVEPVPPVTSTTRDGRPRPWTYGQLFQLAWQAFTREWGVITVAGVLTVVIAAGLNYVLQMALGLGPAEQLRMNAEMEESFGQSPPDFGRVAEVYGHSLRIGSVSAIMTNCLTAFLWVGMMRIVLAAVRGQPAGFGMLFGGFSRHLTLLCVYIPWLIAIYVGTALCAVPGLLVAGAFFPAVFLVADTDLGPVRAFRAALAATKGQRWKIIGFLVVSSLLSVAGAFACCVGLFVSVPVSFLSLAALYTSLSGRASDAVLFPPRDPASWTFQQRDDWTRLVQRSPDELTPEELVRLDELERPRGMAFWTDRQRTDWNRLSGMPRDQLGPADLMRLDELSRDVG